MIFSDEQRAFLQSRTEAFDASIVGYTQDELDAMNKAERAEVIQELLHQSADLAHEIVRAFRKDLTPVKARQIESAFNTLNNLARSYR
jgi:hypothetical protein